MNVYVFRIPGGKMAYSAFEADAIGKAYQVFGSSDDVEKIVAIVQPEDVARARERLRELLGA